jgi:zinc finger protein CreA/MIG
MRVHTGERNHKCPFPGCETRCSRQDNLQQHYRIHLSPRSRRSSNSATRAAIARAMENGANAANSSGRQSPNRSPLLMSPATSLPVNALGLQSADPRSYDRRSNSIPLHQVSSSQMQYPGQYQQVGGYSSYPPRADSAPSPTYGTQYGAPAPNYNYPPYASPYPPPASSQQQMQGNYPQSSYPPPTPTSGHSRMLPSDRSRNVMGGVPAYANPSPNSYTSSFPDHPSSAAPSQPSSGHATPNTSYHREMHSHSPQTQTGSQVVLDYSEQHGHGHGHGSHPSQGSNGNFASYPPRGSPPLTLPPIHTSYRSTAQPNGAVGAPMPSPTQNGNVNGSNSYGNFPPTSGDIGGPGKWRPYAVPMSDTREVL